MKTNKSEVNNWSNVFKFGGAVMVVGVGILAITFVTKEHRPVKLDPNAWWGQKHLRDRNDTSIRPFKIVFSNEMIKDLKNRLLNQRKLPPPLEGVGFEYGFNSNHMDPWLKYWTNSYPFEEREDFLNRYHQYKTNIQGLDIHFIRVRPKVSNKVIVPLLLLHGWPGSVREFYETIPHLTSVNLDRDFAVEVIAPSLPGFGFSDEVLGFHTNLALALTWKGLALTFFSAIYPSAIVDPSLADRMYPLKDHLAWYLSEAGYLHLQATKPDTLGAAMSDSPGGLLAYILQIFSTGTRGRYVKRPDGGLQDHYARPHLIDNLMMYWVPNSITTTFRIYAETLNKRSFSTRLHEVPTPVPTWTMHAKDEIVYQPPAVLKTKFTNLLNSTVLHDGGHFLALEMPEVFAEDVLKAIASFRQWHKNMNKK